MNKKIKRDCFAEGNCKRDAENIKQVSLFGTNEWAVATMNAFKGCDNGCHYCYAQANFSRYDKEFAKVKDIPVAKDLDKFKKDFQAKCRKAKGIGKVMFPSTHDITPLTLDYCIKALKHMLQFEGNSFEFLIVTKPRIDCVERLCKELEGYTGRILFRFTIGSADDAVLKFWEPGASSFSERLECVKYAYNNGFKTSISIEPRLDDNTDAVIKAVYPFVTDAIWLGSANKMKFRLKMNGCADEVHLKAAEVLEALNGEEKVNDLYSKWGSDRKIKWKESLKKILGLEISKEKGADI